MLLPRVRALCVSLTMVLLGCAGPSPCPSCDCGHPGVFHVGMQLAELGQDEMILDDETMRSPSLTREEDGGVTESVLGPTQDGGTVHVETSHDLGLNPGLPMDRVSVSSDTERLDVYATQAGALSFGDLGVQLITHDGAPSTAEGPVLAPVTGYGVDPSREVVTVTIDQQTLTTPLHTVLPFQRGGQSWCFSAEAGQPAGVGDPVMLSHWTVFALDALAQF